MNVSFTFGCGGADWSPDGTQLVCLVKGSQGVDLWRTVGEADSLQLTTAGAVSRYGGMSWSPDGSRVAFSSDREGITNVWTVPVDGGKPRQVTITAQAGGQMSWSPDSRRIAFASNTKKGRWDVWTVPASGGAAEPLVSWPSCDWGPEWSPDGQSIAFTSNRQVELDDGGGERTDQWDIWVVSEAGGEPRLLTEGKGPHWSPDSHQIVFHRRGESGGTDIWRIPASGGQPVRLLETPENELFARWSPDGTRILFTRTAEAIGGNHVWIADVSAMEILP